MDHHQTTTTANDSRAEAERLLGIAEKLLHSRDLTGSREFALLAQETEPLLDGSDQILAITDVLLASHKRHKNHHDWYSILQSPHNSDLDLLKKNYRRLALLLHPDKNKFPLSDSAFKLVADAWAVLSDPSRRTPYDHLFSRVDLQSHQQQQHHHRHQDQHDKGEKLPVRRTTTNTNTVDNERSSGGKMVSFWTACPYCYVLYEYPRVFEECCLRCQNCDRAFHASKLGSLPPVVPGKEAYYCCWGFFPLGFSLSDGKDKVGGDNVNVNVNANVNSNSNRVGNNVNVNNTNSGFPNWMPGMFTTPGAGGGGVEVNDGSDSTGLGNNININNSNNANNRGRNISTTAAAAGGGSGGGFGYTPPTGVPVPGQKKRGRPRKNPLPV